MSQTVRSGALISMLSVLGGVLMPACAGPGWHAGPGLLVNRGEVAQALGDPAEFLPSRPFDPSSVPVFGPPHSVRPCCAFGMDLKVKLGAVPVPGYEIGNVTSIEELGPHEYGTGAVVVEDRPDRHIVLEKNGLIYTCRGGFIDTAHIRDNADRTLYIAMQLLRSLPSEVTVDMPEEGTRRRLVVKALPRGLIEDHGRWHTVVAIAAWANFQLSVWHEIVTWYGWESTRGFSEKVSAFSLEDLYSNVLGTRIADGIILNQEARTREEYDHAMDAWIAEALRRLVAVPREQGRLAMKAVDGRWWDSGKLLPDNLLVKKRYLDLKSPLSGWIVTDALDRGQAAPAIRRMCDTSPATLPLAVPERIGGMKIEDLASITFEFSGWLPEHFPLAVAKGRSVTAADFPAIMEDIRREGLRIFGPGFDHPG